MSSGQPETAASLPTGTLLGRVAEQAAVEPDGDRAEYWSLVGVLRRRGDRESYDQAAVWCRSQDPLLRELGAHLLGQLGCLDAYPFAVESAPLLMALLDDPEIAVVSAALSGLGFLGQGDPERLAPLATSPDAEVRFGLAFSLLTRDEPLARETLIALSRDSDADVRDWATFGLGSQSDVDSEAIRLALADRLDDEDRDTRGEAMVGLARRGDVRAEAAVIAALSEPDVDQLTIEAAEELGRGPFLSRLEALLETRPDSEPIRTIVDASRKSRGAAAE